MNAMIKISSLEPLKEPLRDPLDLRDPLGKYDAAVVAGMVKALSEGGDLPPITVFQAADKRFLVDGRHRLRAHQVAGRTEIAADLIHVRTVAEFRIEGAKFLLKRQQETADRALRAAAEGVKFRLRHPGKEMA